MQQLSCSDGRDTAQERQKSSMSNSVSLAPVCCSLRSIWADLSHARGQAGSQLIPEQTTVCTAASDFSQP